MDVSFCRSYSGEDRREAERKTITRVVSGKGAISGMVLKPE